MSYELRLKPKEGEIKLDKLEEYLLGRNNYQKEASSFWYHNGDTGVYFSIGYNASEEAKSVRAFISFSMNYFRPSFFIFEAENEVTSLVSHFNLIVVETQTISLPPGEYKPEDFLTSWNQANHSSYLAVKQHQLQTGEGKEFHTLAQNTLHKVWLWNKNRRRYQEQLGKEYYVPPIWAMLIDQELSLATLWPEGAPAFLPATDKLIIANENIKSDQEKGMSIVSWDEAEPLISKYSKQIEDSGYLINGYRSIPDDIKEYISKLPLFTGEAKRVAFENILDDELWQQPVKES